MRFYEWGRIVKGVNTTPDVSTNEIPRQAKKFGNTVDKDGRPPTLSKKVKGKSTNVLFNLGLTEGRNKNEAQELSSVSTIYVDMDGVLADFFGDWAKLMGKDHWTKIDDISPALQKIRDTEDFWLNLPLTDNAKNLLALIKDVKGEYNILSSPLPDDPNSEPHKREWIKKNLNFFLPKQVIITHDKAKYATTEDGTSNILIDDYGQNIAKWEAAGGIGFKHKDHKFERTAKNIKQHMQEPVEETIIRGKTANRHIHYDPLYKGLENYDGKHLMNDADAIEALLYGRGFSQREDAFRDLLIRKYKITRETDIGALLKSIRDQLEAKNRQHVKDRDAENATANERSLTKLENFADGKNLSDEFLKSKFYDEADDCKESTKKFVEFMKSNKLPEPKVIWLAPPKDIKKFPGKSGEGDAHIMPIVGNDAIDFTAKQFGVNQIPFITPMSKVKQVYNKIGGYYTDAPDWVPGKTTHIIGTLNSLPQKELGLAENFADGKEKGKSRPGRVKRSGASCKGSVSELRRKAKKYSGERGKMYHWCANMKSGKE